MTTAGAPCGGFFVFAERPVRGGSGCTDERIGPSPCVAATNGATSVGQKENRGSGEREGCASPVGPLGAGVSGQEARNGFCWIVVENAARCAPQMIVDRAAV